MKIIKPMNLGLLYRVCELNRRFYLVSTVITFFPFDAPDSLETELKLWPLAAEELGADGVLDTGMPKVGAEYLVAGKFFAPAGKPVAASHVTVSVAGREKRLDVYGFRRWSRKGNSWHLSELEMISELGISYEHAFGGPDYPENPSGKGYVPNFEQYSEDTIEVPNIILHGERIVEPDSTMTAAGYGPYDLTWPQRFNKLGTYDDKWLRERFPGFAEDFDPTFHNSSPFDQQFPKTFAGDEEFSCINMHPEKRVVSSKLPSIRARCFVNRGSDTDIDLSELTMSPDTLWLFPHRERGVLIFRGKTEVEDDMASDCSQMIIAYESLRDDPRPGAHYKESMARRLDKEKGHLQAFNEKDLIPDGAVSAIGTMLEEGKAELGEGLLERNLKKKTDIEIEAAWKRLEEMGLNPDDFKEDGTSGFIDVNVNNLDKLDELLEQIDRDAKEKQEKLEKAARQLARSLGKDYDQMLDEANSRQTRPVRFDADEMIDQLKKYGLYDEKTAEKLKVLEKGFIDSRLQYGHFFDPLPSPSKESRERMRREVERSIAEGESLSGREFPGVDLSGMNLEGINFSECFLEGADLSKTIISGADFSKALLARADLSNARISQVNFTETNFGKADLAGAEITDCKMNKAVLYQARLENTVISESYLTEADLSECDGRRAAFRNTDLKECRCIGSIFDEGDFSGSELDGALFYNGSCRDARFSNSVLKGTVFMQCAVDNSDFESAIMENLCTAMETSFNRSNFRQANLSNSSFRGVNLRQSDFVEATLSGADFSEASFEESNFYRAVARQTQFTRADLSRCKMVSVNLAEASLQGAVLAGCDLRGANLFAADLLRADFSTVLLDHAIVEKTLLATQGTGAK